MTAPMVRTIDGHVPVRGRPRHFAWRELACRHCERLPPLEVVEGEHYAAFTMVLDMIRDGVGRPLSLSSAYRCRDHPTEAAKRERYGEDYCGAHTTGLAADLLCFGESAYRVLENALLNVGAHDCVGVGVNQKGNLDGRFIHVDLAALDGRFKAHRPRVWTY